MGIWELFVIAVGLSMDAFAVSICKGLSAGPCRLRHMLTCGLYFGAFQALMPLIGYLMGAQFETAVKRFAPYIAFGLLAVIGANMIWESFSISKEKTSADFSWRAMLPLSIVTSIDALTVGVTFAMLQVNIWTAITLIGLTTCLLCSAGVKVGSIFGNRYESSAERFGGAVLILMGLKILIESWL